MYAIVRARARCLSLLQRTFKTLKGSFSGEDGIRRHGCKSLIIRCAAGSTPLRSFRQLSFQDFGIEQMGNWVPLHAARAFVVRMRPHTRLSRTERMLWKHSPSKTPNRIGGKESSTQWTIQAS